MAKTKEMAKAIMIQGTMSNAGKSLLAAGLCRIFAQDGYRTAPFKSQNMALNSYITTEGLEMGRAQVVQALAAGVEPTAAMNPILLKPSNDMGSQVIVMGKPIGNMAAAEYFEYKRRLIPTILEAYEGLSESYDILVIEGAGSPAEINLKKDDIVNMGMAKMAKAPVLLTGDIDRGGVFAQLYGTVMLLEPEERARIKGLIINKFRGDKHILAPGLKMIEDLCRIPVTGVVPWLPVDIEDEDSLSGRLSAREGADGKKPLLEIGVIRFPRMSNFTDFHVFSCIDGVGIRYVTSGRELGEPDLIILPGTKNTVEDLLWMRQNGLEASVKKLAAKGVPVCGICGGYQMLGETLTDERRVESPRGGELAGLGLLPVDTYFEEEKTRTRVRGRFGRLPGFWACLSGLEAEGYEIHMGKGRPRESGEAVPLMELLEYQQGAGNGKQDGLAAGAVMGTYVHGIFDGEGIAHALLKALLLRKGMGGTALRDVDYPSYRQRQLDLLADGVRESLDMNQVYRILEEGIAE